MSFRFAALVGSRAALLARCILPLLGGVLVAACSGSDSEDAASHTGDWEGAYDNEQNLSDTCSGIRVPDQDDFGKRVALTFDDGPNLATTGAVLDLLQEYGAHGSFMINGKRVKGDAERDLLRRMIAEGHVVANHTQTHQNATQLSTDDFALEITQTRDILEEVGVEPVYFRFPFGASNCSTAAQVRSLGYTVVGWHADSADWCFQAGGGTCKKETFQYVPDEWRNDMVGFTLEQIEELHGGIALFHDIHSNTVAHLEAVLQALQDDGYTFVTIADREAFPKLNADAEPQAPAGKWVGSACVTDAECDFLDGAVCYQNTVCGVPCEGLCEDKEGFGTTFCAAVDELESGICAVKSGDINGNCASVDGTSAQVVTRFVGSSGYSPKQALVCLP